MTQRHFVLLDHLQAVLAQRAWLSQRGPAPAPASRDLPAAQVGLSQEHCHRLPALWFLALPFGLRLGCSQLGMYVTACRGATTSTLLGLLNLQAAAACAAVTPEAVAPFQAFISVFALVLASVFALILALEPNTLKPLGCTNPETMGSVQATYSPLQSGAAPQLDALQLAQMCAMGFPRAHAHHALAATNCSGTHAWLQAAPAAI